MLLHDLNDWNYNEVCTLVDNVFNNGVKPYPSEVLDLAFKIFVGKFHVYFFGTKLSTFSIRI
jgi:hypothetical protein